MCIFQSGKDIPPLVRLALRTLQYLVIPLLSLSILSVGGLHLEQCEAQPLLPVWHMVAGASGMLVPVLYIIFDELNPWLSRRLPGLSEAIDNVVVFILPLYIVFEVCWLITGSVWLCGIDSARCDRTLYVFSYVVLVNFWIHILTPLVFMFTLCCTRIFPYCSYCAYWNIAKSTMDAWTRRTRLLICTCVSLPLGLAMVIAGAASVQHCRDESEWSPPSSSTNATAAADGAADAVAGNATVVTDAQAGPKAIFLNLMSEKIHIPVWLLVAGCGILLVPAIYQLYEKYCKEEDGGPLIKSAAKAIIILYLLSGLAWTVIGYLWVFGSHQSATCGSDSATYKFAWASLVAINVIMDVWICFKICVVLYWAFLSDD